jgi:topoisomerase IV subunit A
VKASEKGQIKVKQVVDNTAKDVEIVIHLQPGQSPEIAMDALYAFTDCEISISPNACVIVEDKPQFMAVSEFLKYNTHQTVALLKRELEIRKAELMEKILFSSLERIFIENRIYRDIEEAKTWEEVIARIDKGLKPHKKKFYREITTDDIVKLTKIKIKRISRYDSFKADEMLKDLEKELKETQHHLRHLTDYAISYFQNLMEKYGKGRERKTEIKSFQSVSATEVIATNQKLYVNRTDGFVGYGLKRDDKTEYICDCSELDNVMAIRKDGKALISKIQEKGFMGKDILYVGVWKKADDRMVYNVIYSDGKSGKTFAKRFNLPGVTRDKEYDLTQGHPNSKIHYVSGNPNGEAETVEVKLSPASTARKKIFEYDFSELEVKGRGSRGNTITHYPVRKVDFLKAGTSTLSKIDLWYDEASGRLNKDGRGKKLGKFDGDDQIISFQRNGSYKITSFELSNRYDPEKTLHVEKFNQKKAVSAVYVDGESKQYMVKRFMIETSTADKEFGFISEGIGSRLVVVSMAESPEVEMEVQKSKDKPKKMETVNLDEIVEIKGWKALGNRLSEYKVTKVNLVQDEETGLEEGDEDNELIEAAKSEKDRSPKKKEEPGPNQWLEDGEQANLFAAPEKPKHQIQQRPEPKPKAKAEQQNLFGETSQGEKQNQSESGEEEGKSLEQKVESKGQRSEPKPKAKDEGKSFSAGETIEFDI